MGRKATVSPTNALNATHGREEEKVEGAEPAETVSAPEETATEPPKVGRAGKAPEEKVYEKGKFAVFSTDGGFQVRDNLKRNISPVLSKREEAEHLVNGLAR